MNELIPKGLTGKTTRRVLYLTGRPTREPIGLEARINTMHKPTFLSNSTFIYKSQGNKIQNLDHMIIEAMITPHVDVNLLSQKLKLLDEMIFYLTIFIS